jgi:hypothetical protein
MRSRSAREQEAVQSLSDFPPCTSPPVLIRFSPSVAIALSDETRSPLVGFLFEYFLNGFHLTGMASHPIVSTGPVNAGPPAATYP